MRLEWLLLWRTQCPTPSGLLFRQLAPPQSRPIFGSLSLKNWPFAGACRGLPGLAGACPACLPGPAGPPIASRSASEPRERRHRSRQKQRPAPGGAQDHPAVGAVGAPWFSGPAGAGALVGRDRGRSQSLAAARLTISAPSGSKSAPRAMGNFGRCSRFSRRSRRSRRSRFSRFSRFGRFGSLGGFGLQAAGFSARAAE